MGHLTEALALRLSTSILALYKAVARVLGDLQLLADIEALADELDEAELDDDIGVGSLLCMQKSVLPESVLWTVRLTGTDVRIWQLLHKLRQGRRTSIRCRACPSA